MKDAGAQGSSDEDISRWVRAAAWLEERVGRLRLAAGSPGAELLFRVRHGMAREGLESARVPPLVAAPLAEVVAAMRGAAGVAGPLNGLTVLAACLGLRTLVAYPPELAKLRGLWEPEGAPVTGCDLAQVPEALPTVWPSVSRPAAARARPPKAEPPPPKSAIRNRWTRGWRRWGRGTARARRAARKPWEYRVTAVIPHLETVEPLRACVELLRLQTERPYLLVIDTGSSDGAWAAVEALRAEDLEVHCVRADAYQHSEAVGVAQDLAFALCRSEYLFCTHADCFLRRRDYLQWLLTLCGPECPAVGYQMSPRDWLTDQWEGMVSHTATMLHMPTMHRLGVSWSFERAHCGFAVPRAAMGWPDTETCMNLVLRQAGVRPRLIGTEENYKRQVDENLDHVRSYPGSHLAAEYHARARGWMEAALGEARERVSRWRAEALTQAP